MAETSTATQFKKVDIFEKYAEFDEGFMLDLFRSFGIPISSKEVLKNEAVFKRLTHAVTDRRRQIRYWSRHADKLAAGPSLFNPSFSMLQKPVQTEVDITIDTQAEKTIIKEHASTTPPPTMYPETEVTAMNHVLRDIQPYLCTYNDCAEPNEMYSSRTQWAEHEAHSHRKVWQCYQHTDAVFRFPELLADHLRAQHADRLTEDQIPDLVELAETSLQDERSTCPICLKNGPFVNGLQNHLAYDLQRIALFALPRGFNEEATTPEADSNVRQGVDRSAQDSSLAGPLNSTDDWSLPGDEAEREAAEREEEEERQRMQEYEFLRVEMIRERERAALRLEERALWERAALGLETRPRDRGGLRSRKLAEERVREGLRHEDSYWDSGNRSGSVKP
ncbi:hypothetical protein W97_05748 [Coniosporium apollinis CBS 100218]|uniref:C2H2-type domain-containing protein n=1 Tax=Coniosporium apollinis (strain CBS 100218) TaxID=1168221 RepID=R7YXC8_CONA1|nr:uncharacterized protein W97_05748 [Coniosporium apollinis CBS 100218]EON66503.1 hypothetical protein W97_05748 [Coniosporium apollinis CBS 100218]